MGKCRAHCVCEGTDAAQLYPLPSRWQTGSVLPMQKNPHVWVYTYYFPILNAGKLLESFKMFVWTKGNTSEGHPSL